jgi:hypothetical protein
MEHNSRIGILPLLLIVCVPVPAAAILARSDAGGEDWRGARGSGVSGAGSRASELMEVTAGEQLSDSDSGTSGAEGDEPICDASDEPNIDPAKEVVCRKRSWGVDCMIECAKSGLSCSPEWEHPYKPEVGNGKLWKCSGDTGAEVCKYVYENGDECTHEKKSNRRLCKYIGK